MEFLVLYIKKSLILSFGLIIAPAIQGMELVEADLLIHTDNKIIRMDHASGDRFKNWGHFNSLSKNGKLLIKVDCFAQDRNFNDLDWTKQEVYGQPIFPRYIPLGAISELDSNLTVNFTRMENKDKPVQITLHIRDNFDCQLSVQEQIADAVNKYEHTSRLLHKKTQS